MVTLCVQFVKAALWAYSVASFVLCSLLYRIDNLYMVFIGDFKTENMKLSRTSVVWFSLCNVAR